KLHREQERIAGAIPAPRRDGFTSSDACQACHPAQYASWHASYHHTMTQAASPETVVGDFNNVSLTTFGHAYHLSMRGSEFFVRTDDPDWEFRRLESDRGETVDGFMEKQVVMTTGSHH